MATIICDMECKHRSKRKMRKWRHKDGRPCYTCGLEAVTISRAFDFDGDIKAVAGEENEDELVLVIVSGRPCRHIRLVYAVELATWTLEDGWILEEYSAYEDAEVHFWAPIPELPEEARP